MRRVLLIVIDGWTARLLGPALQRGQLPLFAGLARRGWLRLDCVSIFPSITPAATASIITGRYPARHGITGMSWWNPATQEISYYGDDVRTILRLGVDRFVTDFLSRLNGDRLAALTLFETVERHGGRSASFNYLVFRGDVRHRLSPPLVLRLLPSVSTSLHVYGPSRLCFGDFVCTQDAQARPRIAGSPFHRFGLDDASTMRLLCDLPHAAALPDFSVAYFADYDFDSHDRGPRAALETLRRLDDQLAALLDAWGGIDHVLRETSIVVTADHSHSDVDAGAGAAIDLEEMLAGYRTGDPARGWRTDDELMICPNMRAAEVYVRRSAADLSRLGGALLNATGVDHVIWRASEDDPYLHVVTRDRGALRFAEAADRGSDVLRDEYGGFWRVEGDLSAVDATRDGRDIRYRDYPNALERVANGVDHPRSSRLWVTARPGYEFRAPGQQVHRSAGSHGTLHVLDSMVPLLVAGAASEIPLAVTPRIVDVAPLCATALGLAVDTRIGQPHAPP
jgi:hypothetical protein